MHLWIYAPMHACMDLGIYAPTYLVYYLCTQLGIYVSVRLCIYGSMYVRTYIRMHACMYVKYIYLRNTHIQNSNNQESNPDSKAPENYKNVLEPQWSPIEPHSKRKTCKTLEEHQHSWMLLKVAGKKVKWGHSATEAEEPKWCDATTMATFLDDRVGGI